jgi:Uma2 family endonuclease
MSDFVHGTSPVKRTGRYTYGDYRLWPTEERWELIHGIAHNMSPAPQRVHQGIVIRVASQLDTFFSGKPCRPYIAPVDVFLADTATENLHEITTVVQPDAFVVCAPEKLVDEGVRGAPDFIIEVLSPGTAMKDQSEKRKLYEAHRVGEYWIVNPDTFEVFMYTLKDNSGYGLPAVADLREGVAVTRFPGLRFQVSPDAL